MNQASSFSVLRPLIVVFLLLTAVTGVFYPAAVTSLAQALFPRQAAGSLIERDGQPVGSALIGQSFTDPRYFWSRPSATGTSAYNASASGGSNLGPSNPALADAARARAEALRAADPDNTAAIPVDLVAASGSGLDPHISPDAARYQVARIARLRQVPAADVGALVAAHTTTPTLGIVGKPGVNVVTLNLALDRAYPIR